MMPRKSVKRLVFWSGFAVVLWLAVSLFIAYRMTRRVGPPVPQPAPELAWGKADCFRIATDDGQDLGAWFVAGSAAQPIVLLLHGFNGTRGRSECLPQAEIFAGAGCPVLLISHRAHGDSSGDYNDIGYGGKHDVLAAVRWIEKHHPGRDILIYGESMGAAAALFAAGELGEKIKGYVLVSPYKDLRTATRNRTRLYLPPVLDVVGYGGLCAVAPLVLPHIDDISPMNAAAQISDKTPVLLLAGELDRHALVEEAQAVQEQIRGPSELVVIANAVHAKIHLADPDTYKAKLLGFLAKCTDGACVVRPRGAQEKPEQPNKSAPREVLDGLK